MVPKTLQEGEWTRPKYKYLGNVRLQTMDYKECKGAIHMFNKEVETFQYPCILVCNVINHYAFRRADHRLSAHNELRRKFRVFNICNRL